MKNITKAEEHLIRQAASHFCFAQTKEGAQLEYLVQRGHRLLVALDETAMSAEEMLRCVNVPIHVKPPEDGWERVSS